MENKDQYQQSPEPKYECLLFGKPLFLYKFWLGLVNGRNAELTTSGFDFQIWMTPSIPWVPAFQYKSLRIFKVMHILWFCSLKLVCDVFIVGINALWIFIVEYMRHKLGMEESTVPELCLSLYKDYGTTMAGLKV